MTPMKTTISKPKLHYFQFENWMNDPNGLVKVDNVYHLFYQANPTSNKWGNIGWGHAISVDLINWQNLPHALSATSSHMIFSGSAICRNNPISLKNELFAFYTACEYEFIENNEFVVKSQNQCLAYSDSRGIDWQQYELNPILDINSVDFRDPKVVQIADNHWLMLVSRAREHVIDFYISADLVCWELTHSFVDCDFKKGAWECPDLITLREGKNRKSILIISVDEGFTHGGSGVLYIIGDYTNGAFRTDKKAMGDQQYLILDKGPDFFAAQSFFDVNDNADSVLMGWLNNWRYAKLMPDQDLPMLQSLPRKLTLVEGNNGHMLLSQEPAAHIQSFLNKSYSLNHQDLDTEPRLLEQNLSGCFVCKVHYGIQENAGYCLNLTLGELILLQININESSDCVTISRAENQLFQSTLNAFEAKFQPIDKVLDLVLVADHYSIEVFVNQHTEVFSIRTHRYFDNIALTHHSIGNTLKNVRVDIII